MAIPINYDPANAAPASTAGAQGYQDAINKQLGQLQAPTDPNNPVVRAQTDAYNVQSQRGLAQNRDALAEAAYAGGNLNTGGYEQMQQRARENASANEATNTGNVMATAEQQRGQNFGNLVNVGQTGALGQQQLTNTNNQNTAQLAQNANQFGTTSAQNQQAINQALEIAKMNNQLGYYNTNTNANVTTRGQDISGASAL